MTAPEPEQPSHTAYSLADGHRVPADKRLCSCGAPLELTAADGIWLCPVWRTGPPATCVWPRSA